MLYYFIINGRDDIRVKVDAFLNPRLGACDIQYKKYYTVGVGDGTRFVRMYRDFYPREEVCFVACGGSGTVNEVASGLLGSRSKCMAILAFGETDDVIKYWPDRNFRDLGKLLSGEAAKVDLIKAGDSYALNLINIGFDSAVAHDARRYMNRGVDALLSYRKAVFDGFFKYRFFKIKVTADGKPVNHRYLLLCPIGNGQWCGGQFHCFPDACNDDGLLDLYLVRPMPILLTLIFFKKYLKGVHMTDRLCRLFSKKLRAKEISVSSKDLIYLCLDGEFTASTSFDIRVLPKEISLVLPAL